ncbi:helix-turn-helix domain-containing protein [Streptomyces sp. NPDC044780]|uniref:GlxA family transcriptional regulator n=1 Tax=unclassified Streptomyces TaxID=2593676 RepID=UPI0033DD757B
MTVVAVLGLDGALGFELMTPGQVFGTANTVDGPGAASSPRYDVRLCAPGRFLSTAAGWGAVEMRTPYDLDAVADAEIVIVPGTERFLDPPDPEVVQVLRDAAARGSRIASICVGAFTLAASGLLDGARATTHWQWADELARRHPAVEVDPTVLFVDNGRTLTSAGVASGLDVCLHLIRTEAGAELAAQTARRVIMPAWRDGGQAQFIEHVSPGDTSDSLQPTIDWMEKNLTAPLDLTAIARHAAMSVRSLNRKFRHQIGTTPQQLLLQMRIDRARRLLETTHLPADQVAEESGFGSQASLRYHFTRLVGTSPHAYRLAFNSHRRTPSRTALGADGG